MEFQWFIPFISLLCLRKKICSGWLTSIICCLESYQSQQWEWKDIFFLVGKCWRNCSDITSNPSKAKIKYCLLSFRHAPPCAAEQRPRLADHQWSIWQRRPARPNGRAAVKKKPNPLVDHRWLSESAPFLWHQQPREEGKVVSKQKKSCKKACRIPNKRDGH